MSRTGILGGSFDPPHNAHLAMARAALQKIPLDRVLLMPSPRPPHKDAAEMTPYAQRVRMVELAIQGEAMTAAESVNPVRVSFMTVRTSRRKSDSNFLL